MIPTHELTGMILAGGEGRRMGGRDKGLEPFAGLPLVGHVVKRLEGQVAELLINANRNADAYRFFADRVIADEEGGFKGPLMGIYSGLRWQIIWPPHLPKANARLTVGTPAMRGARSICRTVPMRLPILIPKKRSCVWKVC